MGDRHLAVCAIAAALLLAGANGAVAAADAPDSSEASAASDSAPAASAPEPSAHTTDNTFSVGTDERASEGSAGEAASTFSGSGSDTEEAKETAPDTTGAADDTDKKPVHDDPSAGGDDTGKTISRPAAPPPESPQIELGPVPNEITAPVLEAPPPLDIPPAPASPVAPDMVDATSGGDSWGGPPVATSRIIVPFAPVLRISLIGASATARATSGKPTLSSAPRSGNERPELLRASPNDLQLRELPTNAGLAAGVQAPKQASYNTAYLRRPLSEVAAGALPGVAGIVFFTAAGICLGYRNAMAGQLVRAGGSDRFLP